MNNNTLTPSNESEHPQPGGDCVLLAPQPDTEKRKVEGNNSDTRAHSSTPTSAGIAGGATSFPSRRRIKPLSGGVSRPATAGRSGVAAHLTHLLSAVWHESDHCVAARVSSDRQRLTPAGTAALPLTPAAGAAQEDSAALPVELPRLASAGRGFSGVSDA